MVRIACRRTVSQGNSIITKIMRRCGNSWNPYGTHFHQWGMHMTTPTPSRSVRGYSSMYQIYYMCYQVPSSAYPFFTIVWFCVFEGAIRYRSFSRFCGLGWVHRSYQKTKLLRPPGRTPHRPGRKGRVLFQKQSEIKKWCLLPLVSQRFAHHETYSLRLLRPHLRPTTLQPLC